MDTLKEEIYSNFSSLLAVMKQWNVKLSGMKYLNDLKDFLGEFCQVHNGCEGLPESSLIAWHVYQ